MIEIDNDNIYFATANINKNTTQYKLLIETVKQNKTTKDKHSVTFMGTGVNVCYYLRVFTSDILCT